MVAKRNKDKHYQQLALYYKNRAKLKKCIAAIHLEADFDKFFWSKIFNHFLPQYSFDYITYSRTIDRNKATGSQTCLKYYLLGCLSKDFFICIDSDYRWLLQEKEIDINHFIFQTYTYSLENHYCYPPNINHALKKLGLHNNIFDFEAFLPEYSQSLYQLFICHLLSMSKKDGLFEACKFNKYIGIEEVKLKKEALILDLRKKINKRLIKLKKVYTPTERSEMEEKCKQLGLNNTNAYFYFRGHNVFDQVVLKIMKAIRRTPDAKNSHKYTQKEKYEYFTQSAKIMKECLVENICFHKYPEINRIEKDIKIFYKK
jgi:hypothetical protein